MKALALLMFAPFLLGASQADERAARSAALSGEWRVDLRVSLDDEAYSQPMVLTVGEDGVVTGNFYNSEILAGRVGGGQGRLCIAFRTTDGSGLYHSSACLVDGRMVGQTWAEERAFVLPWTAERL